MVMHMRGGRSVSLMMGHLKQCALLVCTVLLGAMLLGPQSAFAADTQVMWRLYNPNTGEHFYTANTYERDQLATVGWRKEGSGWVAPTSGTPVYRLYNPVVTGGDHHYTMNSNERDMLIGVGWRYEGVGWYSDAAKTVPLQRLYNPNAATGTHHYTVDTNERDALVRAGWRHEGVAWYAVAIGSQEGSDASTGSGSSTGGDVPSGPSAEAYYIVNRNSHIFHRPNCPSVTNMNESNKQVFSGTRDQAIGQGFKPCSVCRP